MIKELKNYQDEKGWIGHFDDNGVLEFGDGIHRLSNHTLCEFVLCRNSFYRSAIRARFIMQLEQIYLPSGEPTRHWDRSKWYGKSGTMSGDGLEALLSCLIGLRLHKEAWSLIWKLTKRGGFAWNTKRIGQHDEQKKIPDFFGFRMVIFLLRLCGSLPLVGVIFYPVIALWDLLYLAPSVLVRVIKPLFDRDDVGDDINFFLILVMCVMSSPTPISGFVRGFYYGFRPLSGDEKFRKLYKNMLGCVTAFKWYFNNKNAPPIDDIMVETAHVL